VFEGTASQPSQRPAGRPVGQPADLSASQPTALTQWGPKSLLGPSIQDWGIFRALFWKFGSWTDVFVVLMRCSYCFMILNDVQIYLDCANICFAATDALFSYGSQNLHAAKYQCKFIYPACNVM